MIAADIIVIVFGGYIFVPTTHFRCRSPRWECAGQTHGAAIAVGSALVIVGIANLATAIGAQTMVVYVQLAVAVADVAVGVVLSVRQRRVEARRANRSRATVQFAIHLNGTRWASLFTSSTP